MLNYIKFCKIFCDKYYNKYSSILPTDIIVDIVDTTLNIAHDNYFSYEMVQQHPEFCKQCGMCCSTIECDFFNGRTCDEHATRPYYCTEFPFYEINGESGLILDPDCQFAMKLAEMVLDKEFKEYIDFFNEDIE